MIIKEMILIATKKQMTKTETTLFDPPEHEFFSSLRLTSDVTLFLIGSSVIES